VWFAAFSIHRRFCCGLLSQLPRHDIVWPITQNRSRAEPVSARFTVNVWETRLIVIQANAREGFPKVSKEIVLPRPHAHPAPDEGTRALATGTIHTAYPRGSRMFSII